MATRQAETQAEAGGTVLERLLRRDRTVVLGAVLVLSALSWGYIVHLAGAMGGSDAGMAGPAMQSWTAGELFLLFAMWAVMMVAMMLPSAAPMLLMFATVHRRRSARGRPSVSSAVFMLGYLLVWSGYSVLATLAQWGLHSAALLSPGMVATSTVLGGVILVAAGIYQWTPLKRSCLSACSSTIGFLSTEWREGTRGALLMGMRHGQYCVGCCWILMAILFVGGVMNLLWVAAIAVFVLIEKAAPAGEWAGRATGLALVVWGGWLLGRAAM